MQSQFGSMSLVAEAYERELRADAARVRPVGASGIAGGTILDRVRPAVGSGLIRAGRRLQGTRSLGAGDGGMVAPEGTAS